MDKKERVRRLVETQGIPFTFGDILSSLSVLSGWTYDDLKLYQEVHGETKISAKDFGFTKEKSNIKEK